jgi:hypothetical protein
MRFASTGKVIVSVVLFVAAVSATGLLTGCQMDVNGSLGTKMFYPDYVGKDKSGDPRKPMYSGSGFGERSTAGYESGVTPGFAGMSKDDKEGGKP